MKRSVTCIGAGILTCFLVFISVYNLAEAQVSNSQTQPLETQNLAIPGPINDIRGYLRTQLNDFQKNLSQYKMPGTTNVEQLVNQNVQSVGNNSLQDMYQRIKSWFVSNVNLANAPTLIDKTVELIKQLVDMLAQLLKWLVSYL